MTFGETAEDIARRIIHCQSAANNLLASELSQMRSEQLKTDMTRLLGLMPGDSQQEKEAAVNELIEKVRHDDTADKTDPNEQIKKWLE